jgi:hypothetical protein
MAAVQMGLSVAQQKAAYAGQKAEAKAQADQIRQARDIDQRLRQERLRRVLASQRARFGAQGVGGSSSADAVLRGLIGEAERQNADSAALADHRLDRLDLQLANSRRSSLLATAQPYTRTAFNLVQRNLQTTPLLDY